MYKSHCRRWNISVCSGFHQQPRYSLSNPLGLPHQSPVSYNYPRRRSFGCTENILVPALHLTGQPPCTMKKFGFSCQSSSSLNLHGSATKVSMDISTYDISLICPKLPPINRISSPPKPYLPSMNSFPSFDSYLWQSPLGGNKPPCQPQSHIIGFRSSKSCVNRTSVCAAARNTTHNLHRYPPIIQFIFLTVFPGSTIRVWLIRSFAPMTLTP
ncbi:hypothetical protein GALMADRAFT_1308369 [Galerina marginata CBS 339.88]|uniref:Uncharacterized protein n=1 Tax=Galerina marginata (strain CBS 339.88) TaxID=685588 RepID=A0A067TGW3_GALM3|nr:hypothetical protein GALMADRAFT_1308369 [Galerina marginata CBS 339.88]